MIKMLNLKLRFSIAVMIYIMHLEIPQIQAFDVTEQLDGLRKQFLPAEYRNINFTVDDFKRVFSAKCKKVSGLENSALYHEVENSATTAVSCLTNLVNLTAMQEEIDIARPIGELDTVFSNYCEKAPKIERCLENFNNVIQPCLSAAEKTQNSIMMRLAAGLIRFMCSRGGDQIALFVAEDGPECFEVNKEAIMHCANTTFSEFLSNTTSVPDLYNLPDLVLQPEHCLDLERFETCTIHHLEQCQEYTPANVAESVFRFIKNETSCKEWMQSKTTPRSILKSMKSSAPLQMKINPILVITMSLGLISIIVIKLLSFNLL
uniref:Protein TsetseEP domain-containing protein n=1 Tax=Glossina brevipalpis TaxID=37001 RepID=A0A1A9W1Z4_9MUSC